jgi:hypothetical protein
LLEIHRELRGINRNAAASLMEGFEETLTLHRLGLMEAVGASLKTTNAIENLNSYYRAPASSLQEAGIAGNSPEHVVVVGYIDLYSSRHRAESIGYPQ